MQEDVQEDMQSYMDETHQENRRTCGHVVDVEQASTNVHVKNQIRINQRGDQWGEDESKKAREPEKPNIVRRIRWGEKNKTINGLLF